jgi:glycosyltransferase involved in cell wall biosynthesis
MKKKVAIIVQTKQQDGGIHHYSEALVFYLLKTHSSHFEFILYHRNTDERFESFECEKRIWNSFETRGFKKLIDYLFLISKTKNILFNQSIKKAFMDIDAIILPNITYSPIHTLNIPFSVTIHDLQEKQFPQNFNLKERIKRKIINAYLTKFSSLFLCEHESIASDLNKYLKIHPSKIGIYKIPTRNLFLQHNEKSLNPNYLYDKYNIKFNYLLYPAQIWPHKNHTRLIESLCDLPNDIHLVLIGHKMEDICQLKTLASNKNVHNRVHYNGYVNDEDLIHFYKSALLIVIPSLYESISLPIEEAKELKTPVCCSEYLGNKQGIDIKMTFNPNDTKSITQTLLNALKKPILYKKEKQLLNAGGLLDKISEKLLKNN